ncbi:T-cell surface antigen CD2-like [Bufo bufo]|uniref:T-cell surface antigen CD2-like n=1 Tax=Bufo bufo TaxID=8384 RepID=UPI001ABEC9DC|nr:T-cell surface antigen CD2-like [Bufo bufo]
MSKNTKEQNVEVTCIVNNRVSRMAATLTVSCPEAVERPVLEYDCKKGAAEVRCSTTSQNSSNLTLSWRNNLLTTSEKSMLKNTKEQNVEVTCIVNNRVSHSTATLTVSCPGIFSDIFLILSVAGGAVALIIFIVLVVYSVKYKPWRRNSRSEGDVVMNLQHHQPQLQPTGLTTRLPISQGDFPEQAPIQKRQALPKECPQEPGSKKGKKAKSRRPPPQAPGQTAQMYQAAPHHRTPALPGNHPSEQAPRPQPRTKSKAPRQHRKN